MAILSATEVSRMNKQLIEQSAKEMQQSLGEELAKNNSPFSKLADQLGVTREMTNEEYHAHPGISRSGIMKFIESPHKYWANYLNPDRPAKKTTAAMEMGTALHTLMLEIEKFKDEYFIQPDLVRLPKLVKLKDSGREKFENYKKEKAAVEHTNKLLMDAFEERSEGKKIISTSDWAELELMSDSIINHQQARNLISVQLMKKHSSGKTQAVGYLLKRAPISCTAI